MHAGPHGFGQVIVNQEPLGTFDLEYLTLIELSLAGRGSYFERGAPCPIAAGAGVSC